MQHVYQPQNFIDSVRAYPRAVKKEEKNKAGGYLLDVCVELAPGAKEIYKDTKIVLQSEALAAGELENTQMLTEIISCSGEGLTEAGTDKQENAKIVEIWFHDLPLRKNVKLWDEDEGNSMRWLQPWIAVCRQRTEGTAPMNTGPVSVSAH